jgi:small subunit ribosomal protein S18
MERKSSGGRSFGGGKSSGGRSSGKGDKDKSSKFKVVRKKKCRFCRSKTNNTVDYKDFNGLRKLTTLHGKIFSRKRSGNCTTHQRQLKVAVKRARFLALL